MVHHEYLGALMLLKSGAAEELVTAVRSQHITGATPGPLVCLVHLADNLCKAVGLGYREEAPVAYNAEVLDALQLNQGDLSACRRSRRGLAKWLCRPNQEAWPT